MRLLFVEKKGCCSLSGVFVCLELCFYGTFFFRCALCIYFLVLTPDQHNYIWYFMVTLFLLSDLILNSKWLLQMYCLKHVSFTFLHSSCRSAGLRSVRGNVLFRGCSGSPSTNTHRYFTKATSNSITVFNLDRASAELQRLLWLWLQMCLSCWLG